jgi:hypothetical protein
MTKFTKFLSDDAGAVTVDWVALTAGVLILGIMVVYAIANNGVRTHANSLPGGCFYESVLRVWDCSHPADSQIDTALLGGQ